MKVISVGSQRINCQCCGSCLEYDWTDITVANQTNNFITCPICSKNIEVDPYIGVSTITSNCGYTTFDRDCYHTNISDIKYYAGVDKVEGFNTIKDIFDYANTNLSINSTK